MTYTSRLAFMLTFVLGLTPMLYSQAEDLPKGFEQIIPRGRIAAISQPHFVAVGSANIADDTWVLGVVIDGQARAYSLNLLNSHEVVNDRIGNIAFAAVW